MAGHTKVSAGRRSRHLPVSKKGSASLEARLDALIDQANEVMADFRRVLSQLRAAKGEDVSPPPLPKADAQGYRPASETMQALLARDLIERRKRAGLTQSQLAELAKVRTETINRLETGRHAPNVRTVDKIDAALIAAGV